MERGMEAMAKASEILMKKEKCLVCGGMATVRQLAMTPLEKLSHKEPVCRKHVEEIIKYLQRRQRRIK